MRRPLLVCCVSWVLGASIALSMNDNELILIFASLAALLILLHRRRHVLLKPVFLSMILMLVSAAYALWYDARNVTHWPERLEIANGQNEAEQNITVRGTIKSVVTVDGDRASFVLVAERIEKLQISIRLMSEREKEVALQWQRGDVIELSGLLEIPGEARNFDGFNYRRYLRLQHIHWQVSVKGLEQVYASPPEEWGMTRFLRWNDAFRKSIGHRVELIFSEEQAGFMKGLTVGIRDDLDPEQFQQFSQIGMTHILVISGLHVGVILFGCLSLMRLFGMSRETSLLIAMWIIPLYVVLTGGSPSVVRAGLMAMIGLYAARRKLLKDGLHIIGLVACLMLLWNPYYLLNVSFQLSFLVTLGLIIGVPRISRLLPDRPKWVMGSLAVTIVAQWASFPLTVFYFNQFSLLSLVANFLLVPLYSVISLPLGVIAIILGSVDVRIGVWIAWIVEKANAIGFWLIGEMNEITVQRLIWSSPSVGWIAVYYMLPAAIVWLVLQRLQARHGSALPEGIIIRTERGNFRDMWSSGSANAVLISVVSGLFFGLLIYGYYPNVAARAGTVSFIDVGQGDCMLIRSPSGRIILLDGGGTLSFRKPGEEWKDRKDPYEVGRKLLVPLLRKRGIHHIDYVIATHHDTDHIGGLQAVLEQIPVRHFVFNGTVKMNAVTQKLLHTALELKIPLLEASAGNMLQVDEHTVLEFLFPLKGKATVKAADDQNPYSIVFVMQMYNSSFLFTGDMDFMSEQIVLSRLSAPESVDRVDVLKVAHHGSRFSTSEEWLHFWKPKSAVISVGAYNSYGHPTGEVLDRLHAVTSAIYRTDQQGEIQMRIDKNSMSVRTKF